MVRFVLLRRRMVPVGELGSGIIVWANSLVAMATEGAAIWGGNDGDAVGSFSSW